MKIFDVDGNGSVSTFSDGLMILKYILGQRGDDLTNSGALIGGGATRDTPEIEAYLGQIEPYLDADGDGAVRLNDGYLIVAYLVGLTGDNLISSPSVGYLVSGGASRDTAEKIAEYLLKMKTDV